MERATGQSTRIIDEAIQTLFTTGRVTVVDHHPNKVANDLTFKRVIRRLHNEHFSYKGKEIRKVLQIDDAKRTIELINWSRFVQTETEPEQPLKLRLDDRVVYPKDKPDGYSYRVIELNGPFVTIERMTMHPRDRKQIQTNMHDVGLFARFKNF